MWRHQQWRWQRKSSIEMLNLFLLQLSHALSEPRHKLCLAPTDWLTVSEELVSKLTIFGCKSIDCRLKFFTCKRPKPFLFQLLVSEVRTGRLLLCPQPWSLVCPARHRMWRSAQRTRKHSPLLYLYICLHFCVSEGPQSRLKPAASWAIARNWNFVVFHWLACPEGQLFWLGHKVHTLLFG